MSFRQILDKYAQDAISKRDKGDKFERIMRAYFHTDPKYSDLIETSWLWKEFPYRAEFGGGDTGIDLVLKLGNGNFWAVQCKCVREGTYIDKAAVDTFLSTSAKTFETEQGDIHRFANRIWVSTTNNWSSTATESLKNQLPPVTRINLADLNQAPVDWEQLENEVHGQAARGAVWDARPHQQEAIDAALEHFRDHERGKLIMACGTGKTFTALRLAEAQTKGHGTVLFLVPSISLLGQSLREWTAQAREPIDPICICSDREVSKSRKKSDDSESFSVIDLALPASTDVANIKRQFQMLEHKEKSLKVVFSTYQSIDVIAKAQKDIGFDLDLIICDEAHRTTGVTLADEDESAFVKVHDNDFLKAKKRLYMTATPRLYGDDAKSKADEADALLCSMDDPELYGEEVYRIGFGEAVERDLLSDYKVLILTLSESDLSPAVQSMIANKESEINTDDASKLIGCINALSKHVLGDEGIIKETDPEPMQRAVAFCSKIVDSKKITAIFNEATDAYIGDLPKERQSTMTGVSSRHIDGTMSAPERDALLDWLKGDDEKTCRVLTNVRCLSEGVDVPSLDAVMFLSARNSQVDVVQSVGRVMRKSPGKQYGYIIIPVVVPSDVEPEKALDDNERYKVVWTVLNALRAHDDRFNATVNKIELNRKKPDQILVGGTAYTFDEDGAPVVRDSDGASYGADSELNEQLRLKFAQLQDVMYARMVKKVGTRTYWEQWAKNVAEIAERQVARISRLVEQKGDHKAAFEEFLAGLRNNINPSITAQDAIDMLSQHIITKPVFEALFEGYSFVQNNAVSVSMQRMLDLLEEQAIEKDTQDLQKFYDSVKRRAAGIDNAEGKQRIIIELYDKFFKAAFPKMAEQLGIVYTPVEVVDFIIHSVDDVLQEEFGRRLSDENIHILDPFTGTGTFITRLLQSGLIDPADLPRKYATELHANEIVLLAYYIAAVNIENAYHDQLGEEAEYESFEGIVLTDTFQMTEKGADDALLSDMFPQNSARVERQKKAPLRVIMGNPPYSVGQKSENDNAKNQEYPKLDAQIAKTYVAQSNTSMNKALYDAYIKAFRWSTDRLDPVHGGVIAFISNGGWLDGKATSGFRKAIEKEFTSIWVFNLRGNQRTSGERSRKEGGKIFGSGSRTPISVTLLVKNPKAKGNKATIHYYDIGDYLSRDEKLGIIKKFGTISSQEMKWRMVTPNEHGDWINQRNDLFDDFIELGSKGNDTAKFFTVYSNGVVTSRDAWVYNFSRHDLEANMARTVAFYNEQLSGFSVASNKDQELTVNQFINTDPKKISWSRALKQSLKAMNERTYKEESLVRGAYRPFMKQCFYFDRDFNECVYQLPTLKPTPVFENKIISLTGVGANKTFSTLITDEVPNLDYLEKANCFPLYYYDLSHKGQKGLFDDNTENDYIRRDGVSDFILNRAQKQYGNKVTKEDIFYYVYGFLHSPEYRTTFANDLKKMLPRLPLVDDAKDFWAFTKAGRELAELHINYEDVPPYPDVKVTGDDGKSYRVQKMRYPKKGQTDTIIYNSKIRIENIPAKAYEYVVNGKSAIDWIMDRYQVKPDKKSGITNDPNDWAEEVGNPRYILDLLLSVINVSVQTVDIVNSLPELRFDDED